MPLAPAIQMSKAFLDEYGLLPPLLEIMNVNQVVDVLRVGLACVVNILTEGYRISKLVEGGLVNVVRPLSGHEDEQVQQYVAAILLAISACPGLEEWLVSIGYIFFFSFLRNFGGGASGHRVLLVYPRDICRTCACHVYCRS